MRVLHISGGTLYGGIETMLATLARCRELCPALEPEFALCFPGRLSGELTAAGVKVYLLGEPRLRHPLSIRSARGRLAAILTEGRFDAVICHAAWPHAVFGRCASAAGTRLICWLHDATDGRNWLERWARMTRPDLVICNSRFTAGRTAEVMFPSVPVEIIHPPLERPGGDSSPQERAAVRAELNTCEGAAVIVMAARMQPWKGHRMLIEALSGMRDERGWMCWIAGGAQRPVEAEYAGQIQALTARLGLGDRVRFLGQRADVPRLFRAADIHCQPNIGPEPFGIAFIEALYAGIPVVTTAMGGAAEVVDDSCGILAAPGDAVAVSLALRRLINSPALRLSLGAAGPARAAELCDPARQLARLCDLVARVAPPLST